MWLPNLVHEVYIWLTGGEKTDTQKGSDEATPGERAKKGGYCCVIKAVEALAGSGLLPPPGLMRDLYVQYTRPLLPHDERESRAYASQTDQIMAEHNLFCTSALPVKTVFGVALRPSKLSSSGPRPVSAETPGGPDADRRPPTSSQQNPDLPLSNPSLDSGRLDRVKRWMGPGKARRLHVDWRYQLESSGRFVQLQSFVLDPEK